MLNLEIKISADATEAKRELAAVEKGIQKVESSSKTSGGSISKVMQAVAGDTSKVNSATAALSDTTKRAGETHLEYGKRLAAASMATAGLGEAQLEAAASTAAMTGATASMATVATAGAAALVVLAAGAGAVAYGLYSASAAYVKQSGIIDYHQASIDRVSDAWEHLKFTVGQAVVGSGADVTSWVDAVAVGLGVVEAKIVSTIDKFKQLYYDYAMLGSLATGGIGGLPTPQNATKDANGELTAFGRLQEFQQRSGTRTTASQMPDTKDTWAKDRKADADAEAHWHQTQKDGIDATNKAKQEQERIDKAIFAGMRKTAEAQQQIQLWTGRNTQALKEQIAARRVELSIYPPLIENYSYLTKEMKDQRTGLEKMNDSLKESARIQGGELATAQEHTHKMIVMARVELENSLTVWEKVGTALYYTGQIADAIPGKFGRIASAAVNAAGNIAAGFAAGGPVGGIVAAAAEALKALGGLLGPTDYEKRVRAAAAEMKQLTREAINAAGSMERLALNAQLVGIHIQGAFDSKDPEFLKQILGEIDSKTTKLNAAMQEYGFTWEDLGDKQRAAKLGDQFTELLEKTQLLQTAGIDYATILERQAKDYSQLLQDAIRTGTEIPIALQPILNRLLEAGQLIGANGEKLEDLGDVQWAKSLTQGFDQVTAAIYELRDALVHGVGGAIDDLNSRQVHIRTSIDSPDLESRGDIPGYVNGTNGYEYFGSGKLVALHGWEKVTPLGKGGSGSAPVNIAVSFQQPVMANDYTSMSKFAQFTAEATMRELRRRGVPVGT